jgi:hypothetical protein
MWDIAAIILAFLAIVLRWRDCPREAAVAGYGSAGCSSVAARRWRRLEAEAGPR